MPFRPQIDVVVAIKAVTVTENLPHVNARFLLPRKQCIIALIIAMLSIANHIQAEEATPAELPFSFTVKTRPINLDVLSLYIDSPLRQTVMNGSVWIMGALPDPYHNPISVPRWKGPDFEHMVRQPDGAANFPQRTASSFINSGLWYDNEDKRLYALMHGEYEHNIPNTGWCRKKTWLASSPDQGLHWKFEGDVCTAVLPALGDWLNYSGPAFEMGPADYDLYVDTRGGYFYATFWNGFAAKHGPLNKFSASKVQVARCAIRDKMAPGKWFKFCNGAWTEPGIGGRASEVAMTSYGLYGNTIYSTYLKRYVRIGVNIGVGDPRFPNVGMRDNSIYLSTCTDLAKQDWTPMAKLLDEPNNPLYGFTLAGENMIDPSTCGQTLHIYNYWEKRGRILDVTFEKGSTKVAPIPPHGSYAYEPHPESGDKIENRHTKITAAGSTDMHYSGEGWTTQSDSLFFQGKIKKCDKAGNSVEFTFHGPDIYWRGIAAPDGGKADIFIDGKLQQTVDLYYNDTPLVFQFAYIKNGLDLAVPHTIKIVARGDKNEKSVGTIIRHMAFESSAESYWASAGFSGIYGKNNWRYRTVEAGPDDKVMFFGADRDLNFDTMSDCWTNANRCTVGINYQIPTDKEDAVRKWIAPHDGTVRIEGAATIDGNNSTGFSAYILSRDSDELWSAQLAFPDTASSPHDKSVEVKTGDSISFIVHKMRANKNSTAPATTGGDSTKVVWDPTITYVDSTVAK